MGSGFPPGIQDGQVYPPGQQGGVGVVTGLTSLDGTVNLSPKAGTGVVDLSIAGSGALLAFHQYAPPAQTPLVIGTTMAFVDPVNVILTFVAPPTGNVLIRADFLAAQTVATDDTFFGIYDTTSHLELGDLVSLDMPEGDVNQSLPFYIPGLTPGSSHTVGLAAVATVTPGMEILAQGAQRIFGGPVISTDGAPVVLAAYSMP